VFGREAIKALTWKDVADIVDQFSSLNPYDRAVVPGSLLKIEDDNFDPETKRQRQLHCYTISSKRDALFVRDSKGQPTLTKWSEHGLGHLCHPTDLESDNRAWIPKVWLNIVRRAWDSEHGRCRSSIAPPSGECRSAVQRSCGRWRTSPKASHTGSS
jgi:hypothetical protein